MSPAEQFHWTDVVRTGGAMARAIKALQLPSLEEDKKSGKNGRPIQIVISENQSKY
jgi:hypothetical protein